MASMNTEQTLAHLQRRFEEEAALDLERDDPVTDARGDVRNKVLQVRLSESEYADLERAAGTRGLAPSTLAREAILRLARPQNARGADAQRLIDQFADFIGNYGVDQPAPEKQAARVSTAKYVRTRRRC